MIEILKERWKQFRIKHHNCYRNLNQVDLYTNSIADDNSLVLGRQVSVVVKYVEIELILINAYSPIPKAEKIAENFKRLIKLIE